MPSESVEAEDIRLTERKRVRALVDADVETSRQLHADDFQLINPFGVSLSKEQYLGAIASGELKYVVWEPEAMEVRVFVDAAIVRYRAEVELVAQGDPIALHRCWFTDAYEKRDGQWQVVWSQATRIR